MDFEILVFEHDNELDRFLVAATPFVSDGISHRRLASHILLISKSPTVASEAWGQFRSAGFRSICGDWGLCFNETEELYNGMRMELELRQAPFVEVFRGERPAIICSEPNSQLF